MLCIACSAANSKIEKGSLLSLDDTRLILGCERDENAKTECLGADVLRFSRRDRTHLVPAERPETQQDVQR